MSNKMERITYLIDRVNKLQENTTLWQLLPEHMTDTATDAIVSAEYFGDNLTPVQIARIIDDLTSILDFVKSATENI